MRQEDRNEGIYLTCKKWTRRASPINAAVYMYTETILPCPNRSLAVYSKKLILGRRNLKGQASHARITENACDKSVP